MFSNLFVLLSYNPKIAEGWGNPDIYLVMTFSYSIPFLAFAVLLTSAGMISREWENGTVRLLFAQPLSDLDIVSGKIAGALFASCVLSLVNVGLIYILSVLLYGSIISIDKVLVLLLVYALFFYAILGLTLLFSTATKNSMGAFVISGIIYVVFVEIYAIQTMANMKFIDLAPALLVLFVGMWIVWPQNLVYEAGWVWKYIAPNVDAHRIVFGYLSPSSIPAQEISQSIIALLAVGTVGLILSILLVRRV